MWSSGVDGASARVGFSKWVAIAAAVVLGMLWAPACSAGSIKANEHLFARWQHDTHNPDFLYDPLNTRNSSDLPMQLPLPASKGWVELVSWQPRVFIWHNFLTEEETRHIINLSVPGMKRSTVVGAGGASVEDDYRTSYGTFLKRYQDAVVERVENKVAAWTAIPVEHQEDLQVLRYGVGQFYKVHADTLRDEQAGVRVATVLLYLNEPEEGGETSFPNSQWVDPQLATSMGSTFSDCAKGQVGMRPKRGDALLFWSINPDGVSEDYHASHQGCPVLRGAKWTATKWIHARPFRPTDLQQQLQAGGGAPRMDDPGVCEDTTSNCAAMAQDNGCEKHRNLMVVDVAWPGQCRRTCGACKVCQPGDQECYNQNRRAIGYLVHNPAEIK